MFRVRLFQPDGSHEILPTPHDKLVEAVSVARRLYLSNTTLRADVVDKYDTVMASYPRTNTQQT